MQMLYRDGRARPTQDQLDAEEKRQKELDDKEAIEFRNRMQVDRSIFSRDQERRSDLHLQLSEKYMIYKDYATRAMINPQNIVKGDNRVFYIRPDTIFLEDPRNQNSFRNDFMKQISTPPQPEPFTIMADQFQKATIEDVRDQSLPQDIRHQMVKFYKRRQYKLQHKRYKYLQRWTHFALTSELVDKVSLKFSPNYSKIQFELENAVKRFQRLEGEDHFATDEKRPQRKEANGDIVRDDLNVESLPKQSALRLDDIDVYNRVVTYEEKCNRASQKFINKAKWTPMSHRFDVYARHQQYFQNMRQESLDEQEAYVQKMKTKGNSLIEHRKLGDVGKNELAQLVAALPHSKREKKASPLIKDIYMAKAKYNYELPPMILWNQIDLKLSLADICVPFKINGENMEVDNGNSFSYSIIVQFPNLFLNQVLKTQFAYVDSVPTKVNPKQLAQKNIQKVLKRNMKKYGKTTGANTLLELIEIKKEEENMNIEYINQVEKALFGQFNDGQNEEIPKVRLAKSHWLPYICFKPELSKEQQQQAAFFSGDRNPLDECACCVLEILNVNDVTNANLTLDSLSQVQYEKLKHGHIKSEFLKMDRQETQTYFTEDQIEFLTVFQSSLKTKSEYGFKKDDIDIEEIGKNSLFEAPQHLLFAHYLLSAIAAREHKTKLLYTLNVFRSIQKRLALELREFGSRDRVMGDINISKPMERQQITKLEDATDDTEGEPRDGHTSVTTNAMGGGGGGATSMADASGPQPTEVTTSVGDIDNIIQDEMVDINRFRYQNQLSNIIYSTCPIIPKYHTTFGEPIDRQEISAEFEQTKDADPKKGQAMKLMGRVDKVWLDENTDCYMVTDDYGFNLMYDCTFMDMRAIEQEILKIVSFYINKVEPMQDRDLRNVLPNVDRLAIIREVLEWEEKYQRAKLQLCMQYMEAYEHTCDTLEQQRLIQIVVDLMAKRPRMNLAANYFKDSYRAEIDALNTQVSIMKEFIRMQMDIEFRANTDIREILEKTYRLVYEQIDNNWQEYPKADVQDELMKRDIQNHGVGSDETKVDELRAIEESKPGMFHAKKHAVDPMQFADMLGVPFSSLEMLMKQHHERDPVVKTSLHEHVSFIKIQEGYPIFIYETAVKAQNMVKINPEGSRDIGILDFYESLANLPRVIASIQNCCSELNQVHKPDNGFMSAALDVVTLQFLHAELKGVRAEEIEGERINSPRELELICDDSILSNSDKMLFHMKELVASIEDPDLIQNPFVMTKLDLKTIQDFPFDDYQGSETKKKRGMLGSEAGSIERLASLEGSVGILDTGSDEQSINDLYMEQMKEESSDDDDFNKKLKMQAANKDAQYPRLKQKKFRANIPSLLEISCNAVEVIRLRSLLIELLIQREDLSIVYKNQMQTMAKDGRINFKDSFNFSTFLSGTVPNGRWKNFVDTGPGHHTTWPTNLAVTEFDPTMISCLNFSDPEAFKALLCPLGLEELRCVYRYELMNLNMLIVAIRTNQALLDNLQRHLAELDLLCEGYAVSNPVNLFQQSLHEMNYKRLPDERRNAAFAMQSKIGPYFFNIMNRKSRSRENIEKLFQKCRLAIVAQAGEKTEVLLRQMRTCRLQLLSDYCEELTAATCLDSLKLELLHETSEMRRRAYLLPRDSMVHKLPVAKNGEHTFAAYMEEDNEQKVTFCDEDSKKILNFWAVPSFAEILSTESQWSEFYALNLKNLYTYDLGKPGERDEFGGLVLSEFAKINNKHLLKKKLPTLTHVDIQSGENQFANFQRVVDFKECYSYTGNRILAQLYYFRQFQNLFDLEFFSNKLPSKSFSIAGLEQNVLSGLPFWDEEEGEFDSDDYLEHQDINDPMYADQSDAVDSPHRNQLALRVVARIAEEKKSKMKLLQEIEVIKDKFIEWGKHMRGLELSGDVRQAGEFLNQLVQQSYLSLCLVFMSMQDTHGAAGTAPKEMHQLREVTQLLSHRADQKVTYTNGFHVNHAITNTERIMLSETVHRPDYDDFFKAVQPVIDEEAINPTEFILLAGLFQSRYTNNYSYRSELRYLGAMPKRDYHYLDCKLINIDTDLRKYITSALIGIESQSKSYACARLNTSEQQFIYNLNLYREVFNERKIFNRQLIRSKILKRALMVLVSKNPLPVMKNPMKALSLEFSETFNWKVMTRMDEIERQRQLAAIQDQQRRNKLEEMKGNKMKSLQGIMQNAMKKKVKNKGEETILQTYDQATCEVDVFTLEIQNYMILTGKRMIERETNALAKCFEMNGKRQQILIHPMQQFASTFDQAIDKKSHLDIINKVDSVQRMLTQFMNRCLPIETLTSGAGFTISAKDLGECLTELCRSQVKSCEIEMRTRCEQLSLLILQYENLLYTKDMQLLNLENKLKHAKEEINKIINTKVFSRGNNLIYELDMSTRQLRLMKDNVFSVEKGLKEKIRLYFDKDLEQTRVLLDEQKRKFKEYQLTLNAYMRENVAENINYIDEVMKKRVEAYKDVHNEQDALGDSNSKTSINQSMASLAAVSGLMERPNDRKKELLEKYSHLLKKGKKSTQDLMDPFNVSGGQHDDNYEVIFEEMERLKESETESRNEVLSLQNFIRQQRMLQKLKESVQKQKHDYKVDNLKQQQSSNAVLWEQLAEAEKREKILKQELERSQFEIATQEKIIERLKDDVKAESREKQKLIQFKSNKSKRLNELESKAREFEVLENVDLQKLLAMMERKERRIEQLEKADLEHGISLDKAVGVAQAKVRIAQEKASKEQIVKDEAINKILEMRNRQTLLNTEDETLTVEFWQNKWSDQQQSMADLREENLILHKVVHEAAQNQIILQSQVQELNSSGRSKQHTNANLAQSQAMISAPLQQLSASKREASIAKQSMQIDKNPYMPTTESIEDEWNHKNKQTIRKNSMIPQILNGQTNPASLQLLEPQRKPTLLPVIRAKESARAANNQSEKVNQFAKRHRSVDPRAGQQTKRLNVFQPKGAFGMGSNELRYEDQFTIGMLKDPSIKFHQMMEGVNYQVFTPNKLAGQTRSKADGKMLLTTSTMKTQQEQGRNNINMSQGFELPKDRNQATQVTHMTTFNLNQNSQNVFATLSSNQMPTYNLSPAPQVYNVNNSMFGINKGSDLIHAQDQSFNSSIHANVKTQAASSGLSIPQAQPFQIFAGGQMSQDQVKQMVKIDTASINDSQSISHFANKNNISPQTSNINHNTSQDQHEKYSSQNNKAESFSNAQGQTMTRINSQLDQPQQKFVDHGNKQNRTRQYTNTNESFLNRNEQVQVKVNNANMMQESSTKKILQDAQSVFTDNVTNQSPERERRDF